ncbi:MAG: hypothetical protein AAB575_04140 [Patescibacteria group bacterium]
MALLNGETIYCGSFKQIGERIFDKSGTCDGKGIRLVLTLEEEFEIERILGFKIGYAIVRLIVDAVEKKTGVRPKGLAYTYGNRIFET